MDTESMANIVHDFGFSCLYKGYFLSFVGILEYSFAPPFKEHAHNMQLLLTQQGSKPAAFKNTKLIWPNKLLIINMKQLFQTVCWPCQLLVDREESTVKTWSIVLTILDTVMYQLLAFLFKLLANEGKQLLSIVWFSV